MSYISMLESGSREPNLKVIGMLSERLGVPVEELSKWLPAAEIIESDRLRLAGAEFDLAAGDGKRALREFTALCDSVGLPAVWGRARALESIGDLEEAISAFETVVTSASGLRDPLLAARALTAITRCHVESGNDLDALRAGLRAREILIENQLQSSDEYAQTLSGVMGCYYGLGDIASADSVARELIPLVDAQGSWKARASAYWNAAGIAEAVGDIRLAVSHSTRALALLSEGDDERAWGRCAQACAWFLMRLPNAVDQLDLVDNLLDHAATKLAGSGTSSDLAYVETEQARSALLRGDARKALLLADRAVERLGSNARAETPNSLLVLAESQLALDDFDSARKTADSLEMTLLSLPHSRTGAIVWRGLAEVHRRLGNHDAAYRALEHALNAHAIYVVDRETTRKTPS